MTALTVALGDRSYPVYFEHAAESALVARVVKTARHGRALVVSDERVARLHGERLVEALRAAGLQAVLLQFAEGEASKTLATVARLADEAIRFGVDRTTPVVALGGGLTGDVAGLLAALLLRGVPLIQVPTTTLSQVDSSVGGKTGVNHPLGKNLIGAFHQPAWVQVDTAYLDSLPLRDRRAGLAEAVKHAALASPALLAALTALPADLPPRALGPLIQAAVAIKAQVVAADEREAGQRQILNLGHTLGHALESASHEHTAGEAPLRHGEAVSLGLAWALEESVAHTGLPPGDAEQVRSALIQLGLPVDWRPRVTAAVIDRLASDKKIRGEYVHLILLAGLGRPLIVPVTLQDLRARLLRAIDGRTR
ncbi:MAG: 3-dehydroquinate synthase [Myxococcales bacterium]|nr:3-dehydroquinate synthase [Myxococcales bacterium]